MLEGHLRRATPFTNGADGFPRRRFSVAEVFAMLDQNVLSHDEKFELIEGEFFPMSPKRSTHELIKNYLNRALSRQIDDGLFVGVENTLYLDDWTFVDPDLLLVPSALPSDQIKGRDVLLAVEVAVTTLRYDRDKKAPLYARHGVPLYWLIDGNSWETTVYSAPVNGAWTSVTVVASTDLLTVPALPGFQFRLADVR